MKTLIETFKALGNEHRLQILLWLNNPSAHFSVPTACDPQMRDEHWVCVGLIAQKSGLAQSVISSYLNALKAVNLVESQRVGKWTYYRIAPNWQQQLQYKINELFQ